MQKSWFYSKTIWIAIAEAAIACIFDAKDVFPDYTGMAIVIVACIQIILRLITNQSIGK